eukprot:9473313-Pyramimonas_sp.AAC.2
MGSKPRTTSTTRHRARGGPTATIEEQDEKDERTEGVEVEDEGLTPYERAPRGTTRRVTNGPQIVEFPDLLLDKVLSGSCSFAC